MIGSGVFWQTLQKKIRKEIASSMDDIASGKCTSFDHYRCITGYIAGLNWVLTTASALLGEDEKLIEERKRESEQADKEYEIP